MSRRALWVCVTDVRAIGKLVPREKSLCNIGITESAIFGHPNHTK